MTTPFKASVRPDVLLRRYAHFEDPAPAPTPDPAPSPAPDPAPQGVTFTPEQQEAINKLIGKARTEGKQAGLTDFLKKVGAEKPEDVETGYKAHVQKVEGEKSEAQKAIDAAAKEKERADKAEADLLTERQQRMLDRRDSAIKAKASNAHDLDAVLEWANRPANAELLKATVGEDGNVVDTKVDALIAAARKGGAYLFKAAGPGSPSLMGGRAPQGTPPKVKTSGHL